MDAMAAMARELERSSSVRPGQPAGERRDGGRTGPDGSGLSAAQLRSLVELGQAARNLRGLAAGGSPVEYTLVPRFFRLLTGGVPDSLPDSTFVRFEFQVGFPGGFAVSEDESHRT